MRNIVVVDEPFPLIERGDIAAKHLLLGRTVNGDQGLVVNWL